MSRFPVPKALLVCALLVTSLGLTAIPVAAQANVQISSVSISPDEPTPGERVTVETTVQNLASSDETVDITSMYIRTSGTTDEYGRVGDVGSIAPGGSVTVPMSVRFDEAGEQRLTVHVTVQNERGNYRSYEYPVFVTVEEPSVRADLSATPNESDTTAVGLTNLGNVEFADVELTASDDGEVVARRLMADVEPNSTETTTLDIESRANQNLTFTATYEAAGQLRTTTYTTTVQEQVLGEVRLTGVEATRTGSSVTIDGEAANLGSTDVESVIVTVQDSSPVQAVAPNGEYFVGSIEASEFATFELTAEAGEEIDTVPVAVSYIVDNERVTRSQQLDIGSGNTAMPGPQDGADGQPDAGNAGGGPPLLLIGLVLVLLVVVTFGVYRWRAE